MAITLGDTTITGLGVGGLPDGVVNADDIATGAITRAKMGYAGAVLQVLQTVKTDTASTQSTTFVDTPGMSVIITPTSTSSKVLVMVTMNGSSAQHGSVRLVRGSTNIALGDAGNGSQTRAMFQEAATYVWTHMNNGMIFLDSPDTTSATTYKLQWAVPWSASYYWYINRGNSDDTNSYSGRTLSTITVMEIAG